MSTTTDPPFKTIKLGIFLTFVLLSVQAPLFGERLQGGIGLTLLNTTATFTFAWSGSFPGEEEQCLPEEEETVESGRIEIVKPPDNFIVTDFVIKKIEPEGEAPLAGYNVKDPPGNSSISRVSILCATDMTPLFGFVLVGEQDFGPVTAVVPSALDGFEPNGLPRLFEAESDETGFPILNEGPGSCFIATAVRVNDPETGEILEPFDFIGETVVCGEMILEPSALDIPTLSRTGLYIFLAVIVITGLLAMRARVAR